MKVCKSESEGGEPTLGIEAFEITKSMQASTTPFIDEDGEKRQPGWYYWFRHFDPEQDISFPPEIEPVGAYPDRDTALEAGLEAFPDFVPESTKH
jgi:hypothetical protein